MVNLPPDQNEQRDRDPILSFDELLAVVLALLGIGAILWWGMSRGRNILTDGLSLGPVTPPLALDSGLDTEGAAPAPTFEADTLVRPGPDEDMTRTSITPSERGLPGLAEPRVVAPSAVVPMAPAIEAPPLADPLEDVTPPPLDISDVPEDHWAYPFILDMYEQGLLPDFPSGQFEPDKPLNRAELASLMNQAFVAEPVEREPFNFADVSSGYWASDAIDQVVERGFMSGYPDNEFRPERQVPRYEVLVSLATGLDLAIPPNQDQMLQGLGDLQDLPNWAKPKVAASAQNGLVVNHPDPNQLRPSQTATRAEIVTMMHQALVQEGRLENIESEFVVSPQ